MIDHLQNQIDNFYSLSEVESTKLLEDLLSIANENPNGFIKLIQSEPYGFDSRLPIFYEVLSKDLENGGIFL